MAHNWSDIPPAEMLQRLEGRGLGRVVRLQFELLSVQDLQHIARELVDMGHLLKDLAGATALVPLDRLCRARYLIYNFPGRSPARLRGRAGRPKE